MRTRRAARWAVWVLVAAMGGASAFAQGAQTPAKPYEPTVGQPGKDVVWVPTSDALVEKFLQMAGVTAKDYVIDLGSGDGRTVIAAARRGATALGIEYNPDMVELAKANAEKAGVANKASFVKADIFESDFSKASVVTLFLLPSLNMKLRPRLLDLAPGTRIASNTFTMEDWEADEKVTLSDVEGCQSWCTALLWIVPAKVAGTWQTAQGPLELTQQFQRVSGTLGGTALTDVGLRGDQLSFTIGTARYAGRVKGSTIEGTISGGTTAAWRATRP